MRNCCDYCDRLNAIINILKSLQKCDYEVICKLDEMICSLEGITCSLDEILCELHKCCKRHEQLLAHKNPLTVAGEYPHAYEDRFVVSAPTTRFLDMLNSNLYIIFKIDNIDYDLPVYFKDSVEYEHPVVLSCGTPVKANQLQLNGLYSAKYQYSGGYIILNSLTPLNPDVIPV